MSEYTFAIVNGHEWHDRLEPLYKQHYAEMQARLKSDGVPLGPYNPNLRDYHAAMDSGLMATFIVTFGETVVGYSNIWITPDMHSQELIASEDTIYMLPEHRNGTGKKLAKFILAELGSRGVKRVNISPVTDLRVGKIWQRMGFKPVAQLMTYTFGA